MAVSIVAASQVAGGTSPLTCTKPAGTANGDIMIAFHTADYGTYAAMTAPAGWTLHNGLDRGNNNIHMKIWTKTAASEGANYAFAHGSSADTCVTIVTLRGADVVANWITTTPTWADSTSTTRVAPSLTGVGGLLLSCAHIDTGNRTNTWTPPSGMTEQSDVQSTTWDSHSVASLLSPPNPTLTRSFVASTDSINSTGGIAASILIPASATGTDHTANPADTIGTTDAVTTSQGFVRAPSDTAGITDTLTRTADYARPLGDPIGLADSATTTQGFARTSADNIGVTDVFTITQTLSINPADSIGVSDSATFDRALNFAASDAIGISDEGAEQVADIAADYADPVGITDTAQFSFAATLLGEWGFRDDLTDSSGSGHTAVFEDNAAGGTYTYVDGPLPATRAIRFGNQAHGLNLGRTGLEPATGGVTVMAWMRLPTITASNQMFAAISKARSVTSSRARIGLQSDGDLDYAARWSDDLQFGTVAVSAAQATWHHLALVDGPAGWAAYFNGTLVASGVGNAAERNAAPVWDDFPWLIGRNATLGDQWAADGMAVSGVRIFQGQLDATQVAQWRDTPILGVAPTDAVGVTDSITVTLTGAGIVTADDTVATSDLLSLTADYARLLADTVGATDTLALTQGFVQAFGDTLGLTDTASFIITGAGAGTISRGDAVGVTDTALFLQYNPVKTFTDTIGVTDSASFLVGDAPDPYVPPQNTVIVRVDPRSATVRVEARTTTVRPETRTVTVR